MNNSSVIAAAHAVLTCPDPFKKVRLTAKAMQQWRRGTFSQSPNLNKALNLGCAMPDRPARLAKPELMLPKQMPKRGKGGSESGRIALLHALAHIELNAIDLAWDMIGRFCNDFPAQFIADWLSVARDEAKHFLLLSRRLKALGSAYGNLPAHDGLWEAATKTRHDSLARLAIVPLVFEARGLDVTPQTIERLETAKDFISARILEIIYNDEINHVRIGAIWFEHVCHARNEQPELAFHNAVKTYLKGTLRPPFNDKARISAGLLPNFYQPIAM